MKLTCPSEDRLRDFLEGSVNDAEADQISDHVDDCPVCNSVILKLESDQDHAIQKLRDGLQLESLLEEPELSYLRNTVASSLADSVNAIAQEENKHSGKRLRDYRLVRKIGEGGMGTVYQAVHVHLGKSVALKILPTDKLRSKHAVERFRQEMRAVGKLNHPNVVSASDAGAVDGQHFLVMELVEGADLARIIHDRGTLNVADACGIVRQAAIGLQHAHDIGLVHRDVKPSNLMLAIDGSVKLLDLGLAGLNTTDFEPTANVVITGRLTSVGQVMGTLDYMAPEQIISSTQVDGRADVYALGVTLFQLLTKRTPCGDRSADTPERIEAVLKQPPLEIAKIRSDVPQGLCALVMRMLAKEPENRPQSANDVAEELSRFALDADLVALAESCKTSLDMPSADIEITDDALFVVSHLHTENEVTPEHQSQSRRAWPRHMPAVGLAMIALIFGILLSVFTFRAKDGTVKVELPDGVDPNAVRIGLEQDGETVKIVDSAGDWEVRLVEGQYDVRLLQGADQFLVEKQTLVVESQQTAKVKVTWIPLPDPVAIFTSGKFEEGAKAAEALVDHSPDNGWNHAQAAMMWGSVPLIGGSPNENRENFEKHRRWLAKRWAETGEGANTIPRICCLRPDPPADLETMLGAVTEESAQHPREWRYPHSRMMLLYRLGRYQEALEAFADCRRISPTNRMHIAVDHAWSTMILYRLGRVEEGRKDHGKSMQLYHALRPSGQRELPEMWFDFVELGIIMCELAMDFEQSPVAPSSQQAPIPIVRSIPTTECPNEFQLVKWKAISDTIMDAKLAPNGNRAIFAFEGRPGTYEVWDLDSMGMSRLVANKAHIVRHSVGHPMRSIAIHPSKRIAALGRWHGVVQIVEFENNDVLESREITIGNSPKANSVAFTDDGRHLLIGYQSSLLVVWDWQQDRIVAEDLFPWPVWQVRPSESQEEVLVRGQIWKWRTGETKVLVDDQVLEGQWSTDGKSVLLPADQHLRVIDVQSGELTRVYTFEHPVKRFVCLDGGTRVITGHMDGAIRLLDLPSGESVLLGQLHANHKVDYLVTDREQNLLLAATGKRIDRTIAKDHQIAIWRLGKHLIEKPLTELVEASSRTAQWNAHIKEQMERELQTGKSGRL